MAPTPSSEESPASTSGPAQPQQKQNQPPDSPQDRIRRNVACISCRDSKVRCRASPVAGQPCQRCAKLGLSCVYDRSHKRVTKRSKLELLEQELKSIKEAVNPRNNGETTWSPSNSHGSNPMFPDSTSRLASITNTSILSAPAPLQDSSSNQLTTTTTAYEKTGPTKPRVLGDRLLPGEDIDWYFEKYLQCFHPYLPILRKRDPDECYAACPTLFWAVIYVASRRYARDENIFTTLVDRLNRDVYTLLAAVALDLEAIHAILIICAWPFPTIRFVTDPSPLLISVAFNSCMLLGLHTGRGSHSRFLIGGRQNLTSTDHDASVTWIFCCILSQKIATGSGTPPPFIQHDDTQCKNIVKDTLAPELLTLFELQKFSNRLHTAMAAQICAHNGVSEAVVRNWEDEFELFKPIVTRVETDCSRFMILSTQLEVQSYYFLSPPTLRPNFALNALRAYSTSHDLINTAIALETASQFLTHGTHWIYRSAVDAGCILLSTLHSTAAPRHLTPADADALAMRVRSVLQSCSVRECDLPARGSVILETFWSVRNLLPKSEEPVSAFPERIGAAVTYWCLNRFKDALHEAKRSTEGVSRGLEAFHTNPPVTNTDENNNQDNTLNNAHDPFQGIDWSMVIDDFGWAGDTPVFLGPP
ncbi:Zn(2)-C6 fungal-type domain-containing protein [Fusarium keratoplasticum]|uniref:Zn(2)-C6 fungal-type domain-containing protein n=1 Tax=Fusarium keratoplasticum TaxID=1328300 RepID=A0ACC0QPX3_9HYPO|nr:Zn(2)-C6 fungal-type domain-containing protein [Fusarium keratoplasticum]KAI8660591.1 Zn(2)-C6 fungal-type domain-containing protein [Fusarium keratoplasticum]